jgi:hypothetical protein
MAACPSCKADLEPGADLCLECGEPIGDSPAARLARTEQAAPKPAAAPQRVRAAAPPNRQTVPATKAALRQREADPAAVRCPGCGIPSTKARCPGCGAVLRKED